VSVHIQEHNLDELAEKDEVDEQKIATKQEHPQPLVPKEEEDNSAGINPGVELDIVKKLLEAVKVGNQEGAHQVISSEQAHYEREGVSLIDVRGIEYPFYTLLHLASLHGHIELVDYLLNHGADPTLLCLSDRAAKTAYEVAADKETRNAFRLFMGRFMDKWDWNKARVPSPLTPEILENQEAKKKKKSKPKKKKKSKAKQENSDSDSEASTPPPLVPTSSQPLKKSTLLKKLQSVQISSPALSDQAKQALEREKRARAAEARLRQAQPMQSQAQQSPPDPTRCAACRTSLSGSVPFEKHNLKFCSIGCVRGFSQGSS
jgi:hypothetical protein